jgi:uncharacterized repeat protein (TIGR02543 family)
MWGYFIYEYTKLRPANTTTWHYDEKMMGALYLEFGLYLEMTFKAQAINNIFKYEPTLLDKEWPLLTAGTRKNVYDFAYEIADDEVLPVEDQDKNSANGISMTLPESYRMMDYIDLCEGDMAQAVYDNIKFHYTLSNRNFAIDEKTGVITVTVPNDVQYMECDLTITWKTDKLAFSLHDLAVTIPLVWTNLSNEELQQRFTASVRAGNASDGYTTVWTQRVVKNAPFDLPTDADVTKLLGVDNYDAGEKGNLKYATVIGYGGQATEGLTILQDTAYYFEVTPRTYTMTVKDVQLQNGSTEDRQFTAKFGEAFDLSDLQESGTDDDVNKTYTAFLNIAVQDSNSKEIMRNVMTEPIGTSFAMELLNGATYTATYADNSATAIFRFEGVDLANLEIKMKKGDMPSSDCFAEALEAKNAIVKSISPAFAPITGATTYTVVCEVQESPVVYHSISYNTNGGSSIDQQSYPVGSVINKPTDPEKNGYTFAGWFSDAELKQAFTFTAMPDQDLNLYAKWSGKQYTVNFDVNEGSPWPEGEGSKTVTYGETYGTLPAATRTGFGFSGWYTDRMAGEKVNTDTVVALTADQNLYAHWNNKTSIDANIISYSSDQIYDYSPGVQHSFVFTTGESGIDPGSFTVEYKRQGLDSSWYSEAVNAGTYDVKITRAEDDLYQYFEKTLSAVMAINKVSRSISAPTGGTAYYSTISAEPVSGFTGYGDGDVEYAASKTATAPASGWSKSLSIANLYSLGDYYLFARVTEGNNYLSATSAASAGTVKIEHSHDLINRTWTVKVKTGDESGAGTGAKIEMLFNYIVGGYGPWQDLGCNGSNYERDTDKTTVLTETRDPWMLQGICIGNDGAKLGSNWLCSWVDLSIGSFGPVNIPVNEWIDDEYLDYYTTAFKRNITLSWNWGGDYITDSSSTDKIQYSFDGNITDQYGTYNAYAHYDAPVINVQTSQAAYTDCYAYNATSFTIDKKALYEKMTENGDDQLTFTIKLQFDPRSTNNTDDPQFTKTVTVHRQ